MAFYRLVYKKLFITKFNQEKHRHTLIKIKNQSIPNVKSPLSRKVVHYELFHISSFPHITKSFVREFWQELFNVSRDTDTLRATAASVIEVVDCFL